MKNLRVGLKAEDLQERIDKIAALRETLDSKNQNWSTYTFAISSGYSKIRLDLIEKTLPQIYKETYRILEATEEKLKTYKEGIINGDTDAATVIERNAAG